MSFETILVDSDSPAAALLLRPVCDPNSTMKTVGLLSGGKDSVYNLLHCVLNNHEPVALASLGPGEGKGTAQRISRPERD